ncbi:MULTISPECIES: DUF6578 domain-containing protein [unclassified Streptomyces]|uniref:DUF6578 domain-containing protein n=1 Tax=unclassified Streptomyces TaxID=2593676 RepID=UPI0009A02573|nr:MULTISPECIES: DUF6578 domain-containing protein [unclassified Streptomyces]MDN5383566.1 hypothetical protein [Streptomyces sp. LB8]
MTVRWVFYESWQMECCGTPFSVGQEVSWPLRPVDPEDVLGEHCDKEKYGGMLLVEQHLDPGPEITGRVRAIRLVHRVYEETGPGSRTFVPTPDEAFLEDVDRCPEWFGREKLPEPAAGSGPRRERSATGVLVALDVPDAAPVAPRDRP